MKILLTAFEPFAGSPINPSEQVMQALRAAPPSGVELATLVLPVAGDRAPQALGEALVSPDLDAVVCLGEASGRSGISLERLAVNLLDYRIPDNSGRVVTDQPVRAGGPAAYFSSLPLRSIQATLVAAGIPCELSLTAGAYLCNQIFYSLMDRLALAARCIPAGFIHLPSLPEQVALRGINQPSMALEVLERAIRLVIQVLTEPVEKD